MTNGLVGVLVQNVDLLFCLQACRSILYGTKGNIKRREIELKDFTGDLLSDVFKSSKAGFWIF